MEIPGQRMIGKRASLPADSRLVMPQDGTDIVTKKVASLRNKALRIVIAGLDPAIHDAEMSGCWLYILASKPRGTLHVGVTSDLVRRVYEHQNEFVEGFTKQYAVKMLVYYERHDNVRAAIQREKNVKHWSRQWKIELIEGMNPLGVINERNYSLRVVMDCRVKPGNDGWRGQRKKRPPGGGLSRFVPERLD